MAFKQTQDMPTQNMLLQLVTCISLQHFIYQKKWKISVLLLFKRKLNANDESLSKLRRESGKTRGMVFASPSASQTSRRISKPEPPPPNSYPVKQNPVNQNTHLIATRSLGFKKCQLQYNISDTSDQLK